MKASAGPMALAAALIALGCNPGREADRSAPIANRATERPDLSAMAPPVAEQLRAQFDQLTKAKGDPATPRDDLALAYGEMGKLLLAANAYLDAQPYFENARSLAPADARWTYYLAHTHRLEGQSTAAAALFAETVRARPDDVAALVWLGSAYLDQGNPAAAEPSFEKAVAIAPGVAAGHLGLGRVALERRQFAAAVTHLERVLTLEPNASAVHYPLALAQRALGNTAQAEAHLRQRGGNDLGPPDPLMQEVVDLLHSPVAHEGRGDKAIAAGDFTAAVRYFRRALELAPASVPIRYKLATALSLTGDVVGAVAELQEVLKKSPDFPEAHYSLGVLLLGDGQLDAAIERFSVAVRATPPIFRPDCNWPTRSGGAAGSMRRSASTPTWWRGIPASARRGSAKPCRWCACSGSTRRAAAWWTRFGSFRTNPASLRRWRAYTRPRQTRGSGTVSPPALSRSSSWRAVEPSRRRRRWPWHSQSSATTRRPRGCNARQSRRPGEPASIKRPGGCATTWRCTSGDSRAGSPGGMTRAGTVRRLRLPDGPPRGASAWNRDRIALLGEHNRQDLRRLGGAGVPGHGVDLAGCVERLEEHLSGR